MIRTNHLGSIYFHDMATVKIAYGSENLTKLTGYRCLTCSWITRKDNMHRHLLLLTQAALSTLHSILNRISHFLNSCLNLIHTDEGIKVFQDIFY